MDGIPPVTGDSGWSGQREGKSLYSMLGGIFLFPLGLVAGVNLQTPHLLCFQLENEAYVAG